MDNNPNSPMTWYDLIKVLENQPLWLLKKPIRLFETYETMGGTGCTNYYPHRFNCPTTDKVSWTKDMDMSLEFDRASKKPKERYTIRINRVMDVEVFAESKEQAEEIGRKLANERLTQQVRDSFNEILDGCNDEFVCVHDEVLEVTDGIFTESECEEILKG